MSTTETHSRHVHMHVYTQVTLQTVELVRKHKHVLVNPRIECERQRRVSVLEDVDRVEKESSRKLRESLRKKEVAHLCVYVCMCGACVYVCTYVCFVC